VERGNIVDYVLLRRFSWEYTDLEGYLHPARFSGNSKSLTDGGYAKPPRAIWTSKVEIEMQGTEKLAMRGCHRHPLILPIILKWNNFSVRGKSLRTG